MINKKIILVLFLTILSVLNYFPINQLAIIYANEEILTEEEFDKDEACHDRRLGTMSKESCVAQCVMTGQQCFKIQTFGAKEDDKLQEDLECFACLNSVPPPAQKCTDLGWITAADCGTCKDPAPICVPAGFTKNGQLCFQCAPKEKDCKEIGKDNKLICKKCEEEGGICKKDSKAPNTERCYHCEKQVVCQQGYQPGTCQDKPCQPIEQCEENDGPCFKCSPKSADEVKKQDQQIKDGPVHLSSIRRQRVTIRIKYLIIIIERPWGRIILKKDKGDSDTAGFAQFIPGAIMALGTSEEIIFDLGKETPGLKGIGEVFTPGAKSSTTLEDLANIFNKEINKRTSDFNKNPFGDLEEAQALNNPPINYESGQSSQFGQEGGRDVIINGPVIISGQLEGENAYAMLDSNGVLVRIIRKSDLKDDPQVLWNALKDAETSNQNMDYYSQQAKDFQKATIQGLSERYTISSQARADLLTNVSKDAVVPNDTFFYKPEEKKKKLFGILGSNKKATITIGSDIRMGQKALGGGEAHMTEVDVKDQWGIRKIGYLPQIDPESAWNIIDGEFKNIRVAVIDSGFDFTHPDVPQYLWTNPVEIANNSLDDDSNGFIDDVQGWNFFNDNHDLTDRKGHGTFVSGIIAAKKNNGEGIAGINPGAEILPIKVANKAGETNSINIFRAIQYAVNNGAKVINISLGGMGVSRLEQSAINYAYAHDVIVIVASGNTGEYIPDVGPAIGKRVLTVGAVDYDLERSTISSWGPNNALLAPGEAIYSLHARGPAGRA